MSIKMNDAVQEILHNLKQHPALSLMIEITPAVGELSHEWNTTLHFTARESGSGLPVVIKVGVTEAEMYWTAHLAAAGPAVFPKVFAVDHLPKRADSGEVGFIATERIPHTLIGPVWEGRQTGMLLEAVALFYQAARRVAPRHLSRLTIDGVNRWPTEGDSKNPPAAGRHRPSD